MKTLLLCGAPLDIVDFMVGTVALEAHGKSFGALERYVVMAILKHIERKLWIGSPLLGVKYTITTGAYKPLLTKISECLAIVDIPGYILHVLDEIRQAPYAFVEIGCILLACLLAQVLLLRSPCTNLKRKTFHLFAFLVFYKEHRVSFLLAEGLLLFMSLLSSCRYTNSLLRPFFSRNDKGRTLLSPIYLLSACMYPRLFIEDVEYVSALISICFQDSAASIAGKWFGVTEKSIQGAIAGVISGTVVYFALYGRIDMLPFFIFAGSVEYLVPINDNITIPLFAVLYFQAPEKACFSSIPS
ncbi:similarity with dolichol kinase SC59_yeast [Encephalitozoon cuniculi GB-M1]|uniref:dolichol kinase n=2 Tax=Encephalitozoon cuniculi TaxID=6035 RepID=Q8SVV0_ENCCU|nr:uncharacterized protein ECU04_0670 [Encephalitozoon cuniculi GB-M1]KMV66269.1 putative dolichol kinase [Encephalitozoon cuniculi EcunIII-L]UYI27444.1 hypothetical protein J0A71_06g13140 [Encephalitozoon cuniculi]CAD25254.2 similarity with dolichol kinase SC59_yeast [Encephalitozoon cuniculi GB-M1]